MKRGIYLFLLVLFLFPIVYGQANQCGNNKCEYNTYEFTNGTQKQISISPTLSVSATMFYNGTDSIILSLSSAGSLGVATLSRGSNIILTLVPIAPTATLQSVPVRVEDIDDKTNTSKISFGENALSCKADCLGAHRLRISKSQSNNVKPKIDCNAQDCFITWQNILGGDIYGAVLGSSVGLPNQFLLSNNSFGFKSEPRIKEGSGKALVTWVNFLFHPNLRRPMWNIHGSIFDSNGPTQTTPLEISDPSFALNVFEKTVGGIGFDPSPPSPGSKYWLVTWADKRPVQLPNGTTYNTPYHQIMGAFVNEQGSVGGNGWLNIDPIDSFFPAIVFDKDKKLYILSWHGKETGGLYNIRASVFNQSAAAVTPTITLKSTSPQFSPIIKIGLDVVQNIQKIFILFNDQAQGPLTVFGQFFNLNTVAGIGSPTKTSIGISGSSFQVGDLGTDVGDLVFNPNSNEFVGVWGSGNDVIIQRMDLNGKNLSTKKLSGLAFPSIGYLSSSDRYVLVADNVDRNPYQIYAIFLDRNLNELTGGAVALGKRYTAPTDPTTKSFNATDIVTNRQIADGDLLTSNTVLVFKHPSTGNSKLKLGIKPTLGPIDLSGLVLESSDTTTAVRGLSGLANVEPTHSLFLPNNNNGTGVFVCPSATTLPEVIRGCSNETLFSLVPSVNGSLSANFTDSTNTTYIAEGLTNTGIGLLQPTQNITLLNVSIQGNKATGEQLNFRANYTKNSVPLLNASCTFLFSTPPNGPFNATFNSTSNTYDYSRSFVDAASYQTTVECSKPNETTIKLPAIDFTILAGVAKAPTVLLETPATGFSSSNSSVTFRCSASDTENLKAIDLFANTDGIWGFKNTQTTQPVKNLTATFTLDNIPNGNYQWNCRAANDKNVLGFAASNLSFTVNAPQILDCTANDWLSQCPPWNPLLDSECQPGSTQTRTCPRPTNCKNPDSVRPDETKPCANIACISTDYQCLAWSECSEKGQQTRSCSLKSSASCFGNQTKTDTQTCTPPGNPWLLIGIVIIVVLAIVGAFFYFHRKGTIGPEDEETLYQEENSDSGEPSYDQGEYPPEGGDAGEEEK